MTLHMYINLQGGAPQVISWFINPMNAIDILYNPLINPIIVIGLINQLS